MVHEQDEHHESHSRKRPYPFIHWIQTQSPEPDSKRSPEPENESYKPPLPSPPLLSSKYRSFKNGLDTFGARPGQTENNENAQFDSGKEKVKVFHMYLLAKASKDVNHFVHTTTDADTVSVLSLIIRFKLQACHCVDCA